MDLCEECHRKYLAGAPLHPPGHAFLPPGKEDDVDLQEMSVTEVEDTDPTKHRGQASELFCIVSQFSSACEKRVQAFGYSYPQNATSCYKNLCYKCYRKFMRTYVVYKEYGIRINNINPTFPPPPPASSLPPSPNEPDRLNKAALCPHAFEPRIQGSMLTCECLLGVETLVMGY